MSLARNAARGFTLIEIMIVVAIVGILAAIALPSYFDSVRRSARADARASMLTLMQQQERFFTQNNTYQIVSAGAASSIFKNWSGDGGFASAKWIIGSAACGAAGDAIENCVAITAAPQASLWQDAEISTMTLNSRGVASCTPTAAPQSKCWPR